MNLPTHGVEIVGQRPDFPPVISNELSRMPFRPKPKRPVRTQVFDPYQDWFGYHPDRIMKEWETCYDCNWPPPIVPTETKKSVKEVITYTPTPIPTELPDVPQPLSEDTTTAEPDKVPNWLILGGAAALAYTLFLG